MRTLLVDNGSTLTRKLAALSPGQEDIVSYETIPEDLSPYALILLSGSSRLPILGNEALFVREVELIKRACVPVVGVCFGHELIAHTFGSSLIRLEAPHKGFTEVTVVRAHSMFNGRNTFTAYENHQFAIRDVGGDMEVLAKTDSGPAVIRHRAKPIYGFQFHPEHHKDEQYGDEIFLTLFAELVPPVSSGRVPVL